MAAASFADRCSDCYISGMSKTPTIPRRDHLGLHRDRREGAPRGLAARLVRRRLALGLSQAQAAAAVGVHQVSWARWECGMAEPRGLYAAAVAWWLRGKAV